MKVISIHKKRNGAKDRDYRWTPPAKGMVRAMVIVGGIER